jgi:hypothetical protein
MRHHGPDLPQHGGREGMFERKSIALVLRFHTEVAMNRTVEK